MAKRTAQELIANMSGLGVDTSTDAYVAMLEDITDSVGDVDMTQYVGKTDYDNVVAQRDDFRSRYINRFYKDYDTPNDKGYIDSSAPQSQIEGEEKEIGYSDLFE